MPPALILVAIILPHVSSVDPGLFLMLLGLLVVPFVPRIPLLVRWAPLHVRHVDHPHTRPLVHPSVASAPGALTVQPVLIPLHWVV